MDAQDDKSEICRFASQLVDVADLYSKAADRVTNGHLAEYLRRREARRRCMGDELLARAGISGQPSGSLLPTPDEVWLELKAVFSDTDSVVAASVRSADEMLIVSLNDYLHHSQPSDPAAAAAGWLHDELQRALGPTEERSDISQKQPG